MISPSDAPARLSDLFSDGGASIFEESGRVSSWEEALAPLPKAVFRVASEDPAVALLTMCRDMWSRVDLRLATAMTRGLLKIHIERHGKDHPDALVELGALGALAQRAGRVEEGAALLEEAWTGLRSVVGGRDIRLAIVAGNLGLYYAKIGDLSQAEHLLDQAYRVRKRVAPTSIAKVAAQLGEIRLRLGKTEEGLDDLRAAWLCSLDSVGETHPQTVKYSITLARGLNRAKLYRESTPLWRDLYRLAVDSNNPEKIAEIGFYLGMALYRTHHKEEARRRINESVRWTRAASEQTVHPKLPERLTFLAALEIDQRRIYEAEGLYREVIEAEIRLHGDDSPEVARRYAALGRLLGQMGRIDEAVGYLESAASLLLSTIGPRQESTRAVVAAAVGVLTQKAEQSVAEGDKEGASQILGHALQLAGPVIGFDHEAVRKAQALAREHRIHL